jgi:hypothetical protein
MALLGACAPSPPPQCPECQAYVEAVSTLEKTCLSGQSVEASAKLNGALDIFKKAASGDASVSAETIRGARSDWDAAIGRAENHDIRDCLKSVQDKLLACIDKCVAAKQSSLTPANIFPAELGMEIKLAASAAQDPSLMRDGIVLGVKSPPRLRPEKTLSLLPDGFFYDDVSTPDVGGRIDAFIHRAVKEGHAVSADDSQLTRICLTRSPKPPASAPPVVRLDCADGPECGKFDELDPGWMANCDAGAPAAAHAWLRRSGLEIPFIQSAAAQTAKIWEVPDIESLAKRRGELRDGYTAFAIDSTDLQAVMANGVSLHLRVNGVEVRVEGMPGEYLTRIFNPQKPFHLEFGLQNLDFAGSTAGCDQVTAELRFSNGPTRVGKPVILERAYAALRDGEPLTVTADGHHFTWSAHYERPLAAVDYRVFVQSFLLDSWDTVKDRDKVRNGVGELEAERRRVDHLHLVYQGMPVVAVMRPPLSRPSWGLALGLRQPTGQIRFTFAKDEARQFQSFLSAQRKPSNPEAMAALRADSYIYIEQPDVSRPSTCVG